MGHRLGSGHRDHELLNLLPDRERAETAKREAEAA